MVPLVWVCLEAWVFLAVVGGPVVVVSWCYGVCSVGTVGYL